MKIIKQSNGSPTRLLLFFAGWSASPELFTRLKDDTDTDIMICYDYREMGFEENLSRYREIHLVAWSMGVRMAELAVGGKYTFASATAINGTSCPIHDMYGIPEKIFRGTLDNLNAEGLKRFNRRMCGSREILRQYETFPMRPLDEVRDELQQIYHLCNNQSPAETNPGISPIRWTQAVISTDDLIFPAANQQTYWCDRCPKITEITAPHYPFYRWKQWNEL